MPPFWLNVLGIFPPLRDPSYAPGLKRQLGNTVNAFRTLINSASIVRSVMRPFAEPPGPSN